LKLASLEAIVRTLNAAEVRYLVVGGLAVAAHGYGRVTFDIDLVVQLKPENVRRALKALQTLGYNPLVPERAEAFADPSTREKWIREKNILVFQLYSEQHRETQIDLFISEPFDFDSEYAQAKRTELSPGLEIPFVRLEALIEMKERAARPKDLEDLRQLQLVQERIADDGK
jgi:hypothetical protein